MHFAIHTLKALLTGRSGIWDNVKEQVKVKISNTVRSILKDRRAVQAQ